MILYADGFRLDMLTVELAIKFLSSVNSSVRVRYRSFAAGMLIISRDRKRPTSIGREHRPARIAQLLATIDVSTSIKIITLSPWPSSTAVGSTDFTTYRLTLLVNFSAHDR